MQETDRIRKLRWLCRRGMKELDVLFEAFLENNKEDLTAGKWHTFETLLSNEDDQLWCWLQGQETSDSQPFQSLINEIRGVE